MLVSSLICLEFLAAVKRLEAQQHQILFDASSIARAQTFESQTLEAARFSALGRQSEGRQAWTAAKSSLELLHGSATSPDELELWKAGKPRFQRPPETPRDDAALERLLRDANCTSVSTRTRWSEPRRMEKSCATPSMFWRCTFWSGRLFSSLAANGWSGGAFFGLPSKSARAAEAIRSGNLEARARIVKPDELGQLAATFNAMAGALQDRERGRLDFVAQVAHDLKNPLTFIGGAANLLGRRDDGFTPDERLEWLKRSRTRPKASKVWWAK